MYVVTVFLTFLIAMAKGKLLWQKEEGFLLAHHFNA